jgi:hypothetical protein
MKPEPNPSEPSFWKALGITPIIIDDSTPEALADSMAQLDAAIYQAIDEILEAGNGDA